jgi:phosphoribosylformylglycinamidine synthase
LYLAKVVVTLRKSILDPQGKAVHHALGSLNLPAVQDVRIGKLIELKIDAATKADAERVTAEACKKLLANPVMEDFTFSVEKL